ncbi:MAG: carbohydrate kinase family protein [Candidatus Aenigmatarchaeota archaeon]
MVDLTVLGDVNVDLLSCPISFFPAKDSQVLLSSFTLTIGGGAANFAIQASTLGLKVRLIGLVGRDLFGDFILKKLKEEKVDCKVGRSEEEKTGLSVGIQFEDGSKSLLTFRGTNSIFSLKHFKLEEIKGKVFHLAGYNLMKELRPYTKKIFKYVKKKKMLITFDPDLKSGINFDVFEFKKLLKYVDILFLNEKEGEFLTKRKDKKEIAKDLLANGCKIVVVKCGAYGCVVSSFKEIYEIKGIKVIPKNPTGVGDIFNASFVFEFLKTKDLKKAGIFANAAGALAISREVEERFVKEKEIREFIL